MLEARLFWLCALVIRWHTHRSVANPCSACRVLFCICWHSGKYRSSGDGMVGCKYWRQNPVCIGSSSEFSPCTARSASRSRTDHESGLMCPFCTFCPLTFDKSSHVSPSGPAGRSNSTLKSIFAAQFYEFWTEILTRDSERICLGLQSGYRKKKIWLFT